MTSRTRQLARPIGEILESMAHLFEREGQSEDPSALATVDRTLTFLTRLTFGRQSARLVLSKRDRWEE